MDAASGFRVGYPPDWSAEAGTGGAAVSFIGPGAGSGGGPESVTISVQDLADPSIGLDQFTGLLLTQYRQSIDSFRLLGRSRSTLADRTAERLEYTGQSGGAPTHWESAWLVERGRAYVVTYAAPPDRFEQAWPTAEAIIGSFALG